MADAYVALLHPPKDCSEWGVTFPDFPGCVAAGRTAIDAARNADEALSGHIAVMLADGDSLPEIRGPGDIKASGEFDDDLAEGAMFVLVRVANLPAPKERINIMIDPGVLRRVDEAARSEGASRSSLIERAARQFVDVRAGGISTSSFQTKGEAIEAGRDLAGKSLARQSDTGEYRAVKSGRTLTARDSRGKIISRS